MDYPKRTRIINLSRVVHSLWVHGTMSRTSLTKHLNLNKSSMTSIVDYLLNRSIIVESTEQSSGPKGGRKSIGLSINKKCGYVLGIELRVESYTVLAVDITGQILFSVTNNKKFSFDNAEVDNIVDLIKEIQAQLLWLDSPLLGVGIGLSGIIDTDRQIIKRSIAFNISSDFDFYNKIKGHFDFPVLLENDANCGAWEELVFHRSRKLNNFLFLLIEFWKYNEDKDSAPIPTIGIGISINGRIYRGVNYTAGEFKSNLNHDPKSNQQIAITADEAKKRYLCTKTTIMSEFLRELSRNIAVFVNTFNLSQVFIGGDVLEIQNLIHEILQDEIRTNWLYPNENICEIQFTSLGSSTVAYGAAGHVLDRLFIDLEPLSHDESHGNQDLFFMNNDVAE